MKMRYLNCLCRALWASFLVWILFMWLCPPLVALHYSAKASESIVYFLDTESSITKSDLAPGESTFVPTAMYPPSEMWVTLSFPGTSRDVLEVTAPFSRIDVYIGPGARIERTETRYGFFSRFTNPSFHTRWRE